MPPSEPTDVLDELRDAARRLAGGVPSQGYATPGDNRAAADEAEALASLLRTLRDVVPPELQHQVTEVLRQVLLLLRSLIDFWVARLEAGAPAPASPAEASVEEIRID
jgi:hypothetical protein